MAKRDKLNEFAVYAISFVSMVSVTVAPALALIAKQFTWASSTQIQLLITLPALAMVPAAFISPPLLKKYNVKSLFIINLFIGLIFGFGPFFADDYYLILAMRAISAFSLGFIQILLSVTITTRFPKSEQGRIMGGRNFATSLGAIIISYLAGVLADVDWHMAFLPFLLTFPVIAVVSLGLHKMKPIYTEPKQVEFDHVKKKRMDAITVFICTASFIHIVFLQCFTTNISLYIDAEKFGTATISGMSMAVFNFSGLVCGLLLSKMVRLLRGKTLFAAFLSSAVGILLVGLAANRLLVYTGGFFAGFGMSSLLGVGPLDITGTISKERAAAGISWFAIAIFLGSFLTPYLVNPMANLFRQDSVRMRFIVAGIMLFVQAVLYEIIRRLFYSDYYRKDEIVPEVRLTQSISNLE